MANTPTDYSARQTPGPSLPGLTQTGRDEPKLANLPLKLIDPDSNQPRQDLGDVTDLAHSIRQHGLLNPIIVEAATEGRYRILAGGRRFAACTSLGLATVTCIVRTVEEHSRLALQLIENIHRKDLSPIEEAQGMRRLMNEFSLTQRELAQKLGKSVAAINQSLRVLDIDSQLITDLQSSGNGSKSVLLEIAKESDPIRQKQLAEQAKAGQLTVRKARGSKGGKRKNKAPVMTISIPDAKVVVRFLSGKAQPDRVTEALRAAVAKIAEASEKPNDVPV